MENSGTYKQVTDLKVALAGLGGVGGCCARALHICGVGKLITADFDIFQPKNYSYQLFASPLTVSRRKTDVAENRLPQWFTSPTGVKTLQADLKRRREAERLVDGADLVICALDNFAAQLPVAVACEKTQTPFALITGMGFCVQYTVYLPNPPHSYSSAWKHFSQRPQGKNITEHSQVYQRMMKLQSVLFAAEMAGYTEEALRSMLEDLRKNDKAQFYDLAGLNYTAAALGVLNALRYVTGQDGAVVFPDMVSLDMKHKRTFDGLQILKRLGALNRAWYKGNEAVLACIRKWRQTEERNSSV